MGRSGRSSKRSDGCWFTADPTATAPMAAAAVPAATIPTVLRNVRRDADRLPSVSGSGGVSALVMVVSIQVWCSGSVRVTVVPDPGAEVMFTLPLWAEIICFTSGNPRPKPGVVLASCARQKRSKA